MVKGNTHLFSANRILKNIKSKEIKETINSNIDYYYLGSVIPDSFFFHNKKEIKRISDNLHGKDGNLTNKIIFKMLDRAKLNKSKKELAFIFGYITHCALDIIFHPMIYFLSGNYYDMDKEKREKAAYTHYHIETYIDSKVNSSFFVDDIVNPNLIKGLSFEEILSKDTGSPLKDIREALRRQVFFNRLFRSKFIFKIIYVLAKIGIVHKKNTSLFYGSLKKETIPLKKTIEYRDLISGKPRKTTVNKLFDESFMLAIKMINSAYGCFCGRVSKNQCSKVISGKSLDTGKLKVPVSKMTYSQIKSS